MISEFVNSKKRLSKTSGDFCNMDNEKVTVPVKNIGACEYGSQDTHTRVT